MTQLSNWLYWRRTKVAYFQYKYAIQLAVLKHLYPNLFVFSAFLC